MIKRIGWVGCLLLAGTVGAAHAQSPAEELQQCVTASATDQVPLASALPSIRVTFAPPFARR